MRRAVMLGCLLVPALAAARQPGIIGYSGREGRHCGDCHTPGPLAYLAPPEVAPRLSARALAPLAVGVATEIVLDARTVGPTFRRAFGFNAAPSGPRGDRDAEIEPAMMFGPVVADSGEVRHAGPLAWNGDDTLAVSLRLTPRRAGRQALFVAINDTDNSGFADGGDRPAVFVFCYEVPGGGHGPELPCTAPLAVPGGGDAGPDDSDAHVEIPLEDAGLQPEDALAAPDAPEPIDGGAPVDSAAARLDAGDRLDGAPAVDARPMADSAASDARALDSGAAIDARLVTDAHAAGDAAASLDAEPTPDAHARLDARPSPDARAEDAERRDALHRADAAPDALAVGPRPAHDAARAPPPDALADSEDGPGAESGRISGSAGCQFTGGGPPALLALLLLRRRRP